VVRDEMILIKNCGRDGYYGGICTSPYPIEKVENSPYSYPYPYTVNAGIGDGFGQ